MPYSYTEKKRIRKSFAKREDVQTFPSCWRHSFNPNEAAHEKRTKTPDTDNFSCHCILTC